MSSDYDYQFYADRHRETVYSAEKVLALVKDIVPSIESAVDFGCGVGTWLSVLRERGVSDVLGLDGPWVQAELLEIPESSFSRVDFEKKIELDRRFDLAISLEVAEHISERHAESFVDSLAGAANAILFSAAIPDQGGTGHVNEQWPDYWIEKFERRNFACIDIVRSKIWGDKKIPICYRQNVFLFLLRDEFKVEDIGSSNVVTSLVHPEMLALKTEHIATLEKHVEALESQLAAIDSNSNSFRYGWKVIRRALKARLGLTGS